MIANMPVLLTEKITYIKLVIIPPARNFIKQENWNILFPFGWFVTLQNVLGILNLSFNGFTYVTRGQISRYSLSSYFSLRQRTKEKHSVTVEKSLRNISDFFSNGHVNPWIHPIDGFLFTL